MRRFSELRDLPVDGPALGGARLVDAHFDDRTWRISSLVLEAGHWPRSHRILVAADNVVLEDPPDGPRLRIDDAAPTRDADAELPVSKQMELKYHDYLRWLAYWINGFAVPYAPDKLTELSEAGLRDPHLRSAAAVVGHHILARDGEAGRVDDYLIDPASWYVRDIVVHSGVWPHVHEALLSPYWVSEVSWARACVDVRMKRERVLASAAE
jgi:hypothetical protein